MRLALAMALGNGRSPQATRQRLTSIRLLKEAKRTRLKRSWRGCARKVKRSSSQWQKPAGACCTIPKKDTRIGTRTARRFGRNGSSYAVRDTRTLLKRLASSFREKFNRSGPWDWVSVDNRDQIRKGDWVLRFQWAKGAGAETVLAVRRSRGPGSGVRAWGVRLRISQKQAFQAEEPIRYDAPPFGVGHKFAQALTKAIKKVGVKRWSNRTLPLRALLDALA